MSEDQLVKEVEFLEQAAALLNQQVWCWGRDIERPKGNWLLEVGFDRLTPPEDQDSCPSIYSLQMSRERCVVLRGFGIIYSDRKYGTIFLPRYDFHPLYSSRHTLENMPWHKSDLPDFVVPSASSLSRCMSLALDLIDWIRSYEMEVVDRLGIEYRRSTLVKWDDGTQPFTPAEEMASTWRLIGTLISANSQIILD